MNLSDLYKKLSYGPLNTLALAGEGDGTIRENKKSMIVDYINEAMGRLYTRFPMKQKDVLIHMVEHITNYHLLRKFAQTNDDSIEPYRYIMDLPYEPFIEDVLKILAVYDSYGNELLINDPNHPDAVFVPDKNVVQIARPKPGQAVSIVYQAGHPKLAVCDPTTEIELPEVLVPALLAYVGSCVYGNLEMDGAKEKALNLMSKFEDICTETEAFDSVNTSESYTSVKFETRGWA